MEQGGAGEGRLLYTDAPLLGWELLLPTEEPSVASSSSVWKRCRIFISSGTVTHFSFRFSVIQVIVIPNKLSNPLDFFFFFLEFLFHPGSFFILNVRNSV